MASPLGLAFPFLGLLLSISLGPLLLTHIWHRHYKIFALGWSFLSLILMSFSFGPTLMTHKIAHSLLQDYLPFITMLFTFYAAASGLIVRLTGHMDRVKNALYLLCASLIAGVIGTMAASLIFIRPLLRANMHRPHQQHIVIFFIILVANIGGAFTPIGDPPLFLGFLHGVDFFWPLMNIGLPTLGLIVVLIGLFCLVDFFLDAPSTSQLHKSKISLSIIGWPHALIILACLAIIVVCSLWQSAALFTLLDVPIFAADLVRMIGLCLLGLFALHLAHPDHHIENNFGWEPFIEITVLFAALFICLIPVYSLLDKDAQHALTPFIAHLNAMDMSQKPMAYFWLTGLLSSFLDNAPTYLVFFQMAGGDAHQLMHEQRILSAISMGAVYMGALTYIGNAPNFMIYAIARQAGVTCPHFFNYMFWASLIALPLYICISLII